MPLQRRSAYSARTLLAVAKVNGKTVTRRLSAHEAQFYQQWIGNDRRIRSLLAQIRIVDAKAAELILRENVSG